MKIILYKTVNVEDVNNMTDEELRAIYQLCDVSNNRINPIGESDFVNTIKAHTNSEITAVLDRLKQKSELLVEQDPIDESYQETNYVPLSAIEAERKRL